MRYIPWELQRLAKLVKFYHPYLVDILAQQNWWLMLTDAQLIRRIKCPITPHLSPKFYFSVSQMYNACVYKRSDRKQNKLVCKEEPQQSNEWIPNDRSEARRTKGEDPLSKSAIKLKIKNSYDSEGRGFIFFKWSLSTEIAFISSLFIVNVMIAEILHLQPFSNSSLLLIEQKCCLCTCVSQSCLQIWCKDRHAQSHQAC